MKQRMFGRTGRMVSEVGFGSWGIGGGQWTEIPDREALEALTTALDLGVTFIDTADVYGDGRSEKLIAQALRGRSGPRPYIATKAGKRLPTQATSGYTLENLREWVKRSRDYLEVDILDLVQLHCPPTDLYYQPSVFDALDRLQDEKLIRNYGVSVEKIEEAIKAIEYPNVVSVQIIFNILRQRPIDLFFELAKKKNVAILARVPLASGLLSGKFTRDLHVRQGRPPQLQPQRRILRRRRDLLRNALRERPGSGRKDPTVSHQRRYGAICAAVDLMFDAVSVVIPGARTAAQSRANAGASDLPPLSPETMAKLRAIYETDVKPYVHQRW